MNKVALVSLAMLLIFSLVGCQGETPEINQDEEQTEINQEAEQDEIDEENQVEEEQTEEETIGVTGADLEIISLVRQSMNDALDGGRIPGMAEGSGVLNTRVPGVERLVAKVESPKLKADLERLLDNLVRGAELIRQGQGRDGREYWVEAHKIAHDLDWKLLGNERKGKDGNVTS